MESFQWELWDLQVDFSEIWWFDGVLFEGNLRISPPFPLSWQRNIPQTIQGLPNKFSDCTLAWEWDWTRNMLNVLIYQRLWHSSLQNMSWYVIIYHDYLSRSGGFGQTQHDSIADPFISERWWARTIFRMKMDWHFKAGHYLVVSARSLPIPQITGR